MPRSCGILLNGKLDQSPSYGNVPSVNSSEGRRCGLLTFWLVAMETEFELWGEGHEFHQLKPPVAILSMKFLMGFLWSSFWLTQNRFTHAPISHLTYGWMCERTLGESFVCGVWSVLQGRFWNHTWTCTWFCNNKMVHFLSAFLQLLKNLGPSSFFFLNNRWKQVF